MRPYDVRGAAYAEKLAESEGRTNDRERSLSETVRVVAHSYGQSCYMQNDSSGQKLLSLIATSYQRSVRFLRLSPRHVRV